MAKHITVRAAQPVTKHDEIESVYLTITGCFPYGLKYEDLAETRQGFKEDAERVFIALRSLPGGTFDQLLVLMLQEEASHFIVSHHLPDDYRKMEAAEDLYTACKETLGEMRAYCAEQEFDETSPMKPAFDELKAAVAKAERKEIKDV